ncbi:MAG: dGTP triphosphohydrolase [Planctomycetota bacterium]
MEWKQLLNPERPRKSTLGADHRDNFERDFDRTVFSNPVKRLQDKAQVFPLEQCDAIRTRLTHSLEVSAVARGLATDIGRWLLKEKGEIEEGQDRAIEAIAATCGILHDLGNPPFGHAGEAAIAHWFESRFDSSELAKLLGDDPQQINDFLKFEGNAQSLRLVGKLQILSDYNGLNLTFGTLSASCKYVAASNEADSQSKDHAYSKPGYFKSEELLVDRIREETGTNGKRNPLTFLVEAADDIVYSVADIEDGVKKGILSWAALKELVEKTGGDKAGEVLGTLEHILKAGRENVPEGLPDDVYGSAFRTATIAILVPSVLKAFKENYNEIMSGDFHSELVKECDAWSIVDALKTIGFTKIYCTPSTLKLELMGRKVIGELMDVFWEGAQAIPLDKPPKTKNFAGKAAALLSENYRKVFLNSVNVDELPENYCRFQLVTDYVCGMTDSFATRLHAELTNGI